LFQQIGFNSVQICMHAASEIINIVNQVVHSTGIQRKFLGACWFTLYYSSSDIRTNCSPPIC
jgi:hypothetical protein